MVPINDLEDLFVNYIQNLYAAEQQIMEAMPAIMKKVRHQSLRNAMQHHLTVSKKHSTRLNKVIGELNEINSAAAGGEQQELTLQEDAVNSGITGLITEVQELLNQKIDKSVNDAAIIGFVQKIEHYEICAYGTALAYATQLNLHKASTLLRETLDEEYDADDLLTALAMAALNKEGIPEDWEENNTKQPEDKGTSVAESVHTGATINERNIHSPGGRAGNSHRRYPSGESRGH
jgi:ferritin-like metal-binding protein YciE